ncbi:MAG: hypothetical protein PWQ48_1455 [Thermotogaceae bacterium]|nr:hypothetical protein [Thermotogaceae bacterium]
MKILNKYLIKQSLLPFAIGLGGFIVFVSVELLYQLSDIIVSYRIPFTKLLIVLYYNLPYFAVLGIPVGLLLAIFWVLSQLGSEREIMAFQVHGFSSKKLVIPFLILAIFLSICAYLLNDFLVPSYNMKANEALRRYIYRRPEVTVKTDTFFKGEDNKYFYVKAFDIKKEIFRDVIIYDVSSGNTKVITAKMAYKRDEGWYLKDGRIFTVDRDGFLSLDMNFDEMQMDIKEDIERFLASQKTPRDMTSRELLEKIKAFRKLGLNVSHFVVEFHSKFAVSLGPLIIVLLGVPLSLIFDIKSKSWGVLLTFLLIVLYQGSGAWLSAMGKEEILNPVLSAWLPDIGFATVGMIVFILLDTPLMYRFKEKIGKYLGTSLALLLLLIPSQMFSSDLLKINSEHFTYAEQKIILWGNVEVERENTILRASTITAFLENDKVKTLEAVGEVEYEVDKKLYKSEKLEINFDTSKMFVLNIRGKADFKESGKSKEVFIYGKNAVVDMEKNNFTQVYEGYVTTCDRSKPHYRFQAQYIEIYPDDKLIAHNVIMYIFNIPVMYYPVYFMSLKYDKQPFELSISSTSSNGWVVSMGFNFLTDGKNYGSVGFKWLQKGEGAGITSFFNLPYSISDDLIWNINFQDFDPKESDVHERILKTSLMKKIQDDFSLTIFYEHSRKSDFENIDSRNFLRGLTLSKKLSTGSMVASIKDTGTLQEDSYSGNLYLPSLSLSKVKYQTSLFEKDLTVNIPKFSFDFLIPYSSEKEFSESIMNYTNKTSGSLSLKVSDIDFFGPFGIKDVSSVYSVSQQMTKKDLNFLIKNDNSLNFKSLKYNPVKGLELSTSYGVNLGYFVTEEKEDNGYRFANVLNSGFAFNMIPNVSISLSHNLVRAIGENSASFKYNKDVNLLNITDEFKIPFVNLTLGSEISYDFEKDEKNWSDLTLFSELPWTILGVKNNLKTSTIFDIYDKDFIKTNYQYFLQYSGLKFSTVFDYIYDQENPIEKFVNKLNYSVSNVGTLRRLSFDSEFHITTDPLELEYLRIKLNGNFSDWTNQTDIILRRKQLSMTSSFSFRESSLKMKVIAPTDPLKITSLSLAFSKTLHCWESTLSIDMKYSDEKLKFDKIVLEFHIKDLPDKSLKVYPIEKQVEFGLF